MLSKKRSAPVRLKASSGVAGYSWRIVAALMAVASVRVYQAASRCGCACQGRNRARKSFSCAAALSHSGLKKVSSPLAVLSTISCPPLSTVGVMAV